MKKHKDRPVYLQVQKMADPETGELIGCLVPSSWADQNILRERKYKTGDRLRATLTHPRNSKFHRLVHQLGVLVGENIEGFEGMSAHTIIKRLQSDAGIFCEQKKIDAGPVVDAVLAAVAEMLGDAAAMILSAGLAEIKTVTIQQPSSIAYDCMDEADFRQFWEAICQYIIEKYWPDMTLDQIEGMIDLMPKGG